MLPLLFLLLIPALIGVAIYGVSLLFSHPSPKLPIVVTQPPDLIATTYPFLEPSITLPGVFSLVPYPSSLPKLPIKENQTPFLASHPVVDSSQNDKEKSNGPVNPDKVVDIKHSADENEDDDDDDNDDEGEGNNKAKTHKDGNSYFQTNRPLAKEQKQVSANRSVIEAEKKKLTDTSETSALVRGIAEGGVLTGEEETIDESYENGESNSVISKDDELDPNYTEENGKDIFDDDDDDEEDFSGEKGEEDEEADINRKVKMSKQPHHHHQVSQRKSSSKLQRRSRIANRGNVQHASTGPKPLQPHEHAAVTQESIDELEKKSKVLKPELTLKEIIAIARSAKVRDSVKAMYPLQAKLEKRKSKQSSPTTPTDKKQAKTTKGKSGKKETNSKSPARPEDLEAAIDAIVDEQSESFERALSQIASKIAKSPELEQHKDILEYLSNAKINAEEKLDLESFTSSKIMEEERDLGQKDQRILLFRNPKAVSRARTFFSTEYDEKFPMSAESGVSETPTPTPAPPSPIVAVLLKILNVLAPPFILQLRADLRNLLIWLCSPNPGVHIDGKDANGDDTIARQVTAEDRATLVHPDGSVDFKDVWDARFGSMALWCLLMHWNVFLKEILALFWKRFAYAKEFLIDQLRGLIGLPQNMVPFLSGALGDLNANDPEPPEAVPLHPVSKQKYEEEEEEEGGIDARTTKLEFMMNMYVSPPPVSDAFQPITKAIVHPSPGQEPLHGGFSARPNHGSHGPQGVQRAEQGNDFVSWVVNMIFYELGFFFDAGKQAGALKPGLQDDYLSQFKMETDGSGGDQACVWMKERVVKALKE